MSARSPLICSAVELWYKKMLKIGSLSELTGIDTKIKVAGFQRLYSKWLWLLMAVYKPSFAGNRMNLGRFQTLSQREGRKYRRQTFGKHGLTAARRTDEKYIVAARSSYL